MLEPLIDPCEGCEDEYATCVRDCSPRHLKLVIDYQARKDERRKIAKDLRARAGPPNVKFGSRPRIPNPFHDPKLWQIADEYEGKGD